MSDASPTAEPCRDAELGVRPVVRRRAVDERTPARRLALLIFLLSPLAVLALLCVLIALSIQRGPAMDAPAVGAGAGRTGMANEHRGIGGGRAEPESPEPGPGE